jgi:hypothetical protein
MVFSMPYRQENSPAANELGWHRTFGIDEAKIERWLVETGFESMGFRYQDYRTHDVVASCAAPDFVIGIARKTS